MAVPYSSRYSGQDDDLSDIPPLPARKSSYRDDDDDESIATSVRSRMATYDAEMAQRVRLANADAAIGQGVSTSDDPVVSAVNQYGEIVSRIRNEVAAGFSNLPNALVLYNQLAGARDSGGSVLPGLQSLGVLQTGNATRIADSASRIMQSKFNDEVVKLPDGTEMKLGDMFGDGTLNWCRGYMKSFIGNGQALSILCDGATEYTTSGDPGTPIPVTAKMKDTLSRMANVVPGTAPGDFTGGDNDGKHRADRRALLPFASGNMEYVVDNWKPVSEDLGSEDAAAELFSVASSRCISGGFSNYVSSIVPMIKTRMSFKSGDGSVPNPVLEVQKVIGTIDRLSKEARSVYVDPESGRPVVKDDNAKRDDVFATVAMFSDSPDVDIDNPETQSRMRSVIGLAERARSQGWNLFESIIDHFGSSSEAMKHVREWGKSPVVGGVVNAPGGNLINAYDELVSGNEFLVRGSPTREEASALQGLRPSSSTGGKRRPPTDYQFPATHELAVAAHKAIESYCFPVIMDDGKGTKFTLNRISGDKNATKELQDKVKLELRKTGKFGYDEMSGGSEALLDYLANNIVRRRLNGGDAVSNGMRRLGVQPSTDILGDISLVATSDDATLRKLGLVKSPAGSPTAAQEARNVKSCAVSMIRSQIGEGGPGTIAFPLLLSKLSTHYQSKYGGSLNNSTARAAASSVVYDLTQQLVDDDSFDFREASSRMLRTGTCRVPTNSYVVTRIPEGMTDTKLKEALGSIVGEPVTLDQLIGLIHPGATAETELGKSFMSKYKAALGIRRFIGYSDGGDLDEVTYDVDHMDFGDARPVDAGDFSKDRLRFDASQRAIEAYEKETIQRLKQHHKSSSKIISAGFVAPKAT